jgi:hypothetical protein
MELLIIMMNAKIFLYSLLLTLMMSFSGYAQINTNNDRIQRRFGFGAELGFISGTINNTEFMLGFNGDYQVADNFSFAEMISFTPAGTLFQINANSVARFNIPVDYVSLIPYMGLGFSYGSFETAGVSENSFSLSFPIGLAVTYYVASQIQATGRIQFAITNLDYGSLGKDSNYFMMMFGFRFAP